MGTRRLYDFVDDNPAVNMFPVNYVNDPYVIGQNDKVVAINSAIQVDLMGQVVADSMGPVQFTGIGGQVDFVRGAARSRGGKAIIALPSTAKKGDGLAHRRPDSPTARPSPPCAPTSTTSSPSTASPSSRGKGLRERAVALLDIADPKFRDQIVEQLTALKGEAWLRRHEPALRQA